MLSRISWTPWRDRLVLAGYGVLTWLLQPLLQARLARRAQHEAGYAHARAERFGHYGQPAPQAGDCLWIHAVSLGETRAAAVLLQALRARCPDLRLLLTHSTATGWTEGQRLLRPGDVQTWLPWDTPAATERFLRHFRPKLGVLMETEVWPQLVASCAAHAVPLALVNARLNARSLARARRLAWLSTPAFRALDLVLAQGEADAQRLRQCGARVQAALGNLKFEASPDPLQCQRGRAWRAQQPRPVLMLASSREGEEAQWLQALGAPAPAQAVQWLLVPRHPQRFADVAQLLQQAGWVVQMRSQWPQGGPPQAEAPGPATVWLGDSLGEMALYFSLADVALLGGSFAPLGGQNLIEAAACGCPVLMGPHTFNFADAAEWALDAGAALRTRDMADAVAQAQTLVGDRPRLAQLGAAALAFVRSHQGAAEQTAERLLALAAPA